MGGQGTYDPVKIKQMVGGRAHEHPSLLKVYGLKSIDQAMSPTPAIQKLYDEAAAITHLTRDDPPLYMVYSEPDTATTRRHVGVPEEALGQIVLRVGLRIPSL